MKHLKGIYHTLLINLMVFAILFGVKWNEGNAEAASVLGKTTLTITSRTETSVALKYSKTEGATGYQIYRATKQDGEYKKIKTTKALTYKDTSVKGAKNYYYKVRAYKTSSGENIAYGQRTPEQVVDAWMNSEGHRKNIMSSNFGKIGIGYHVENGVPYWTQLFTN